MSEDFEQRQDEVMDILDSVDMICVNKFRCQSVAPGYAGQELIKMTAMYVPDEENALPEDVRFSTMTPSGDLSLCIANPVLLGKLQSGKNYYVWISEAP